MDPTYTVGGELNDLGSNARATADLVVCGDGLMGPFCCCSRKSPCSPIWNSTITATICTSTMSESSAGQLQNNRLFMYPGEDPAGARTGGAGSVQKLLIWLRRLNGLPSETYGILVNKFEVAGARARARRDDAGCAGSAQHAQLYCSCFHNYVRTGGCPSRAWHLGWRLSRAVHQ